MPKLCGMERRQMSMHKNTEDVSKAEKNSFAEHIS
jgi:hypothetical protein